MTDTITGNAAVDWSTIDPNIYVRQFTPAREEDREVARRMAAWFAEHDVAGHGVDVGTGSYLVPALAMLANENVTEVELIEHSTRNADWLNNTLYQHLDEMWRPYVAAWGGCWHCAKRRTFEHAQVGEANLLGDQDDLGTAVYDLGTMCCVAESITAEFAEFALACRRFLGALRPGSPYVATFSHMSGGYMVGNSHFPAVPVGLDDVCEVLEPLSQPDLFVDVIQIGEPLRPGWTGLIYVEGTVR